jgi:ribosomal protein S18 acetylase RimI-like enzyme
VNVNLRPASEEDREWLYALHCRTMRDVIAVTWGWDETWQRDDFDRRFREHEVSIIECERTTSGGLFVERKADSIYIHEVQVLPEYQSRGIGTAVVHHVIDQVTNLGRDVTLSVVAANPRAKQLYERLGFEVTGFEAPFLRMRRSSRPGAA